MPIEDNIEIGRSYRFDYPKEFTTLPEYSARRGSAVTVERQCTDEEADQGDGMERMFVVRTADGWTGHAWASELTELRHGR